MRCAVFYWSKIMETQIYAVKSDSGEWKLKVLGNPWNGQNGGKDSDLEFFDNATKFHEDKFGLPVAVHYHGYDDSGQPSGTPEYIGRSTKRWVDGEGVWYEVVLDQTLDRAKELWDAAQKGLLRASSGSVAHLVRKVKDNKLVNGLGQLIKRLTPGQYQDGHILEWPNVELSIFSIEKGKRPANSYAVALPMAKAVYEQAGLTLPDEIEGENSEADDREAGDGSLSSDVAVNSQQREVKDSIKSEGKHMELNEVQKLFDERLANALKAEQDKQAAKAAEEKAIQDRIDAEVKKVEVMAAEKIAAAKAEAAEARRLPGGEAPYQTQFGNVAKYDNLSAADASVLAGILGAAKMANRSIGVSENLLKYLAIQIADTEDRDGEKAVAKSAMKMAGMPMKANELNQSTLASYGDEWIGVMYSTQLWDKIRLATPVVGRIPTVTSTQNNAESMVIPISGASPTFYKVAQASAQDANPGRATATHTTSRLGTGSATLTFGKLGAASNYSGELDEDSLINWASYIREDLTKEAAEVLEHIVIDGDTATGATTNINDIGGTPAGTEAFLLFNGFRKLALVTNTANSRSAGTLAIEDYLETIKLMGLGGRNAVDKSKVSFITDMYTQWKSLELAELKSADVYSYPTIEKGVLTNVYGYDVVTSANMHRANQDATYGLKANTSGKIDLDTASNNTTGSILAVRWDQWMLGYRRQMRFEVERDAISDSNLIVVNMRVGMINRDNEASSISYNVTL